MTSKMEDVPPFLTLSELRAAKIAKYDVAIKHLFTLHNSSLLDILGIPAGTVLQSDFPGLEFRRADALLHEGACIHHVEFQAKNDPSMPSRMHEYAFLVQKYRKTYSGAWDSLKQKVVYFGPDTNTMKSPYVHWGTTHTFDSFDITTCYDEEKYRKLRKSLDPYDWIVALLITPKEKFRYADIGKIATAISLSRADDDVRNNAKWLLLIAAMLRNVGAKKLEEIEQMLMINVGESSLLRRVYDQGAENEATLMILDSIESKLARKNVYFSDVQREYLATFDFDQIDQLLEMAIDGDFEAIDAFVTPAQGMSPSQDGG